MVSLKPVFVENVIFSTTSKSPHVCSTCLNRCANHVYESNLENVSNNAPLRCRPMFGSVSLEGRINSNKILKNLKPWKPRYVCATYKVCKIIANFENVGKSHLNTRDHLVSLKPVFVENVIFSTTSKSPQICSTLSNRCAKHVYEINLEKM